MKKNKRKVLKLIAEKRAALNWDIVQLEKPGLDTLYITSNPWKRQHTIQVPPVTDQLRDIEYPHELAHATLAEKHHLLATAYFENDTPPSCFPSDVSFFLMYSSSFASMK